MRIKIVGEPKPLEIITQAERLRLVMALKQDEYDPDFIIKTLDMSLANSITPGVGLAAPQVGINSRIAIVRTKDYSLDLINPIIVEKDKGFINFDEGCLSFPGIRVNVKRYKEIFVKDDLRPEGFVATGLVAVIIQHEVDHLDNIFIIDRVVGKNKIGRNDPCPCGSNKKYKKCCYGR